MKKAIDFLKQSIGELKKSTWLSRQEVVQSTILVAIVVALVAAYVSVIDLGLTKILGVIMGANLGTTATAWIIAILGFKFSLSDIALPIVGFGMIATFFKKTAWKNTGEFLVGFGLLFLGLDFLKGAVPGMSADSPFIQWIAHYSNMGFLSVLLFLFFGVLLTLIVQSSSVAMAITITMAAKGWIGLDLAAAIVLGENIGTTVTANIAALTASVAAKRAAIAHFVFNVLGVIWMLFVFYWFLAFICWLVPISPNPTAETLKAMDITNFGSLTGAAREARYFSTAASKACSSMCGDCRTSPSGADGTLFSSCIRPSNSRRR